MIIAVVLLIHDEVTRQTRNHHRVIVSLNQGLHIAHKVIGHEIARSIDPIARHNLLAVCDAVHIVNTDGRLVGIDRYAVYDDHHAAGALIRGLNRCTADRKGLVHVHTACEMRRRAL